MAFSIISSTLLLSWHDALLEWKMEPAAGINWASTKNKMPFLIV